jgi:hypothetical protein
MKISKTRKKGSRAKANKSTNKTNNRKTRVDKSTNKTNHRNETSASRSKLSSGFRPFSLGSLTMLMIIPLVLFFVRGVDPYKIEMIAACLNLASSMITLLK